MIEEELKQAVAMIDAHWVRQNNKFDGASNFIYRANTLDEIVQLSKENNVDLNYAIHRWYNFKTSTQCEKIFVEYGAVKETNTYHHDVDIYIDKIPYDVKLTVYPQALSSHLYDLTKRTGKDMMIRWMYENQSQEQRKHLQNRLFIVCDGKTPYDSLQLKSDFDRLRNKISNFMTHINQNGQHQLNIIDDGITHNVFSEIIYLTNR
jgi:hypothetical protein